MTESNFPQDERKANDSPFGEAESIPNYLDSTDLDEDIAAALENQIVGRPETPEAAGDPRTGRLVRSSAAGLPWLDRRDASPPGSRRKHLHRPPPHGGFQDPDHRR